MRRTVMAIAGLVLLGTAAGCGQSSLHSAGLGDPAPSTSNTVPPATTVSPSTAIAPSTGSTPGPAAQPATPALPDILDSVQRQLTAKRSAHFDYLAATGGRPGNPPNGGQPTGLRDTGILAWDGSKLTLDHSSQQPVPGTAKLVDDHRILLADALYENVVPGLLNYQAPDGHPWLKITETEPSAKARSRLQDERTLATSLLPTLQLAGFRAAARVSDTAPDPQQGEQATRYDVVVDVRQAVTSATSPELRAVLAAADHGHQAQLHYQLWIGTDQLPVKITSDLPGPDGATGTQTVSYRNWGAKLPITAPPAKQTCTTKDLRPV